MDEKELLTVRDIAERTHRTIGSIDSRLKRYHRIRDKYAYGRIKVVVNGTHCKAMAYRQGVIEELDEAVAKTKEEIEEKKRKARSRMKLADLIRQSAYTGKGYCPQYEDKAEMYRCGLLATESEIKNAIGVTDTMIRYLLKETIITLCGSIHGIDGFFLRVPESYAERIKRSRE